MIFEHQKRLKLYMELIPFFRNDPYTFTLHYTSHGSMESNPLVFKSFYGLVRLIREKIFCKELNVPSRVEFDEKENTCTHIVAKFGDAPVCYCRVWINEEKNTNWAVIDRICTLSAYRGRGFAKAILSHTIELLHGIRHQYTPPLNIVVVHLPLGQGYLSGKLEQQRFFRLNEHEHNHSIRIYTHGYFQRLCCYHYAAPLKNVDVSSVEHDIQAAKLATNEMEKLIATQNYCITQSVSFYSPLSKGYSQATKRGLQE